MKIKTITFVALLSTSSIFGGFDDNAKGGNNEIPAETESTTPSKGDVGGDTSSPQSPTRGGSSQSSNISGAKMTLKNTEKNNKDTIKSGQSTILNTATINLGRGTNASGAKLSISNNRQNNRRTIKSRNGSTVVNTATINIQ